jgi:hypothetical protein
MNIKELMKRGKQLGYTYNGCTAAPDMNFGDCCNQHDHDYQDMSKTRLQSDNDMFKCMVKKGWKGKLLAPLYWSAVRIFGSAFFKRKQRETSNRIGDDLAVRLFDAAREVREQAKSNPGRGQDVA